MCFGVSAADFLHTSQANIFLQQFEYLDFEFDMFLEVVGDKQWKKR